MFTPDYKLSPNSRLPQPENMSTKTLGVVTAPLFVIVKYRVQPLSHAVSGGTEETHSASEGSEGSVTGTETRTTPQH